ncbi:MAG: RecX family transcriptional regulator [Ruminococcus sp.]|nr:RecX family transcriptional regulator [Ruminococcus sp.]
MEITALQRYKGSTFEAELDYERKIYLHSDIIADFGLRTGMVLERDELRKIIYASNFRRAYQRALYLLDYRDYSAKEMYDKLIDTYKSEKLCGAVLEKLKGAGLIDDVRYAGNMARKLVISKRFGRRRALRELTMKGIDRFTAEDALEEYDEMFSENLMELIEKKYSRYLTDMSDRKNIEKVKSALVRYGYSFDEINRTVREYFENMNE